VAYEGVRAWRCRNCRGYLVGRHGAEGIKKRRARKRGDLETESVRERGPDIRVDQPCPKCFATMGKERLRKPVPILLDRCKRCDLLWFDGGELALFQMAYEAGQKGRTGATFRRRLETMSPERRRQFEENLRRLPSASYDFSGAVGSALMASCRGRRHRRLGRL
jgi:Zn-finger nucleic acid-binding protein